MARIHSALGKSQRHTFSARKSGVDLGASSAVPAGSKGAALRTLGVGLQLACLQFLGSAAAPSGNASHFTRLVLFFDFRMGITEICRSSTLPVNLYPEVCYMVK